MKPKKRLSLNRIETPPREQQTSLTEFLTMMGTTKVSQILPLLRKVPNDQSHRI